jgi:hypothetical protein
MQFLSPKYLDVLSPSNPLQLAEFVLTNEGDEVRATGPFDLTTVLPAFVDVRQLPGTLAARLQLRSETLSEALSNQRLAEIKASSPG